MSSSSTRRTGQPADSAWPEVEPNVGSEVLLAGLVEASRRLLSVAEFEVAVVGALEAIATAAAIDRAYILRHHTPPNTGKEFATLAYEWSRPGIATADEQGRWPLLYVGEGNEDSSDWLLALKAGQPVQLPTTPISAATQSALAPEKTLSTLAVPIFIQEDYWGNIGFDDCTIEHIWSAAEISVLETAAAIFAGALQQQFHLAAEREAFTAHERAELEAANQVLTTRDRWLETTAIAANQLLSGNDVAASVNAALRTIGENLGCDRVVVACHIPDANPDLKVRSLGSMRLLYEWDAPNISAQIDHPDFNIISADGFEDWFTQLMAGQWVASNLDDLPNPVRLGQRELGVLSTYAIPIFVDEQFWGVMALDYCREAKRFSSSEIMVFETAAACVGSAIYQDMVRRDRAAQDRAKLLSSVAEAANLLLKSADYERVLPQVVRILGEAVDSDRCGIFQEFSDTNKINIVALWERPGIALPFETTNKIASLEMPKSFSSTFERITAGESLNFIVAEMEESARSFFTAQGCVSVLIVPIMIHGEYSSSNIAFDNCSEPRLYDEAEMAILTVSADSIAAAISRQAQNEALRESEERYRTLFEISSAGIYRFSYDQPIPLGLPIDKQIKLVYQHFYFAEGNRTMAEMYDFAKPEDIVGIRLKEISFTGAEENFDCVRAYVSDPYHQIQNYESEELHADGETRYFLNNIISFIKEGHAYGGWGSQLDITDLKQAQKATEAAEKAILEERNRLAREIHDTLAQSFTGVSLQLEAAKGILNRNPIEAKLHVDRAGNLARRGLSEARRSVRALRSQALETDTLPTALQTALQEMTQDSPIQAQFHLTGTPYALLEDIQTNLLRIGQEAITNVLRHARANTLTLMLQFALDYVSLTITDDGQGCEIASFNEVEGFGLLGMRERTMRFGGKFYFTSAPGKGTVIEAVIPTQ